MRHLLDPSDFSVEEIDRLSNLVAGVEYDLPKYAHVCDGKETVTLSYEPSTRAHLSFESTMLSLGGSALSFSSAVPNLTARGKNVPDTIRIIPRYADTCAMRHPKGGAPLVASTHSSVPVINAGNGSHQHPTQTLADLMIIRFLQGRLGNMTAGFCDDLKSECVAHSLVNALVRYSGIKFVLISPPELRVPGHIREGVLVANNIESKETGNSDEAMPELDIFYMTRVQEERFFNEEDYIRLKNCYILDNTKMKLAKEKVFVLRPLPHVNEISVEVGDDPGAACFRQI